MIMDNDKLIETVENNSLGTQINIKQMLSLNLYNILLEMEKKILNGRIKNPEKEKIRLDYIKAYINGCNCLKSLSPTMSYNPDDLKEYLNTPQEMVDIEPDDIDND